MTDSNFVDRNMMLWEAIQALPKIELHAHLFGSIRRKTLIDIYNSKTSQDHIEGIASHESLKNQNEINIDTAFNYFNFVYKVINNLDTIRSIIREVLVDFHQDNVVYLEMRTTLKNNPEKGITTDLYAQALCEAAEWAENELNMKVRYLLSADRQKILDEKTGYKIFKEMARIYNQHPKFMVGIDIAGNPKKGDIIPILSSIRDIFKGIDNVKLTIHTAEIPFTEEETNAILDIKPDRIGHGNYLTEEQQQDIINKNITVEICPTSNMSTMGLQSLNEHHFGIFYNKNQYKNISICTDDIGLFETSLTNELYKIGIAFNLDLKDLKSLQISALMSSFCSEALKKEIYNTHFLT